MPRGRAQDTINVLDQVPSSWVPHPPTFPDGIHQDPPNFTAVVASEVVGEHHDEVDTRDTEIPGRTRQVCFAKVVQRSRTLSWHSEPNLGEQNWEF